ncbi:DoxX family protein [Flavobacterium sp.]|uniref:DoxX family protein n=1 Tax=Flavobacterium sp. TaxID=239 RepID=UPI0025B7FBC6|nr:DoxX family protein [Flavobacterium sp.]MBA4275681.1 DoxX family protein [Flavobacterium sp.]
MKKYNLIYWISTGLFSAFMLFSAYNYLAAPEMKEAFASLGFTEDYFRIELAVAKFLGALALLLPFVPKGIKNFAYAGFSINIVSAIIAHIAKDYNAYAFLVFSVATIALSYFSSIKLQSLKQNVQS